MVDSEHRETVDRSKILGEHLKNVKQARPNLAGLHVLIADASNRSTGTRSSWWTTRRRRSRPRSTSARFALGCLIARSNFGAVLLYSLCR